MTRATLYGLGSIVTGAAAPALCALRFTAYPFEHARGQDGIIILFTPFVTVFGLGLGALRSIPMIGLGVADVATLGSFDLSAEYFYSYNGLMQWCACMYAKCVELEQSSVEEHERIEPVTDSAETINSAK